MHDYYWENYTEMDQYGYENFDNQQALFSQVNANEANRSMKRRLKRMLDSPFFGSVDFRYEGEDEPEAFASRTVELYRDTEKLAEISRRTQGYIREYFSMDALWDKVREDFT